MHIHNIILIIVIAVGYVGYKYILPWLCLTIEKKKIEGLNRYMGRQVLHLEKDDKAIYYCWDFDFATISDNDYKRIMKYCIRHSLKNPAEILTNHSKIDLSDIEQQ